MKQNVWLCAPVCGCDAVTCVTRVSPHRLRSPRRLRGHTLALPDTSLGVLIHPLRRLLTTTPGGYRGNSLHNKTHT